MLKRKKIKVGGHSMIPRRWYASGNHSLYQEQTMKQVHNLSAGTVISDILCPTSILRPIRISLKVVSRQIAAYLGNYRTHLFSLAAALLIGVFFLSGSYLFLVQLAEHGW